MKNFDTQTFRRYDREYRNLDDLLIICHRMLCARANETHDNEQPTAYKKLKKQCDRIDLIRRQLKNDYFETK